jgi:predicted bacteriocin transport accessory protein
MKKILVLVSVLVLVLTACTGSNLPSKISDKPGSTTEITQVQPSYIVELIENKESFLFYFGNSWCSACQFMKPINSEVVRRTGQPIYYIEIDKTSKSQLAKIYKLVTQPQATPTYIVVIDGVVKESFTPDILVGEDTGFLEEHINLYTVNLIAVLKAKGLITD